MKDFVSKLTFGFLMAQFVPGLIAVLSVTFVFIAFTGVSPQSIAQAAKQVIAFWSEPTAQYAVLTVLAVGSGMAIHGLHWAVLGFLEAHYAQRDGANGIVKLKPVYKTFWHDQPLIIQVLLGPVKIVAEVALLFLKGSRIEEIAIEENVCALHKDQFEAFGFLQDFYLHFAQFYAHTSYALLCALLSIGVTVSVSTGLEFSTPLIVAMGSLWVVCGYFFVISRIQLASLFIAENRLCNPPPFSSTPGHDQHSSLPDR